MTTTQLNVEEFRAEARAWLQANLEPRPPAIKTGRIVREAASAEDIARARVLQRRLFDGGFAGISFPVEYGGRGLTGMHERAFREESLGYFTPDFGVAGSVTFGPIARSLVAHCSPEFCPFPHTLQRIFRIGWS